MIRNYADFNQSFSASFLRHVETGDKAAWYELDRELPETGFVVDIPGYEQPMEMIMIKGL